MVKLHVYAGIAALTLFATHGLAVDTRPAADYSSPKKAIRSFLTAPDEAGMRAALLIAPEQAAQVKPFLGVLIATTRLQQVTQAQYGQSADRYFRDSTQTLLDARLKAIDLASEEIAGDTATVVVPADEKTRQAGDTIILKKAGEGWRIEAGSMFKITTTPRDTLGRTTELANSITTVTDQMIKDVRDNKFASASDAYKEYWKRSLDARRKLEQPATAPATNRE